MIRKSTNTRVKSIDNQNVIARGLAGLIYQAAKILNLSSNEFQTIFTGMTKKQIVDMIVITDGGADKKSITSMSYKTVALLTDLFFYYKRQGEVLITPSLYLQYLDFKTLEKLVDTKTEDKELEAILLAMRGLMYNIIQKSVEETTETGIVSPSDVFLSLSLPVITGLKRMEILSAPNDKPNRFSAQKRGNHRISNADYSRIRIRNEDATLLGDDGLTFVYKYLRRSTFLGAAGSIDVQYTVFEDCILDKATLHHSRFDWTKFINTSIDQTIFSDSKFFDIDFKGFNNSESAVFVNCNFCLCEMVGCKALFIDCDFTDCENEGLRIINNHKEDKTEDRKINPKAEKKRTYIDDVNAVFASESAGVITEMLSGMLEANSRDDMWQGRAMAFIAAITRVLTYLRDEGYIQLSPTIYKKYLELSEIENLLYEHNGKYGAKFDEVLRPLLFYVKSIHDKEASNSNEEQSKKTDEQFGYITMQLVKILNHLEAA